MGGGIAMNWKAEATDRLRQYESLRLACTNIPRELERLRGRLYRARRAAPDGGGGKGGYDRAEGWLLNDLVLREELRQNLERSRYWVLATERALKSLTEQERLILQRLFISPERNGVDWLCQALCLEKSSVYRHRDRALEKFTLALYGAPEAWQIS